MPHLQPRAAAAPARQRGPARAGAGGQQQLGGLQLARGGLFGAALGHQVGLKDLLIPLKPWKKREKTGETHEKNGRFEAF